MFADAVGATDEFVTPVGVAYGFGAIASRAVLVNVGAALVVVDPLPVVIVVTFDGAVAAVVRIAFGARAAVDAPDEPGSSYVLIAPSYGFVGTNVGDDVDCAPAVRDASTLARVIVNRGSERFVTGRLLVARATGGEHRDVLKEACAEVGGAWTRTARGH